jgi:uroporphyrin-III C-methyltransferase
VRVAEVNGITSGLAAVTTLNTPLTHREHAHGVVFVTGHAKPGDSGTDWRALGQAARHARLTLVIYMGVGGAAHIQQELLQELEGRTPVLVVQNATLPQQRQVQTTLDQLHPTIVREAMGSPSVIVVGDVVAAAAQSVALELLVPQVANR